MKLVDADNSQTNGCKTVTKKVIKTTAIPAIFSCKFKAIRLGYNSQKTIET